MIARQVDLQGKRQLAKRLCGIVDAETEADHQ
jgi:hypothetical protein